MGESRDHTLAERWNGSVWRRFATPNPGPLENGLVSVVAITPKDAWALGTFRRFHHDHPLLLDWNGVAWRRWSLPSGERHAGLFDLAATSPTDVWAVGNVSGGVWDHYGPPRILHYDGSQWSVVSAATPIGAHDSLSSVAATSPTDIWAVGWGGSHPTIEHWDGHVWRHVSAAGTTGGEVLYGVASDSPNDAWAVGGYYGEAVIDHWDGTAWTTTAGPGHGIDLSSVAAARHNDAWAVGALSTSGVRPLTYHWDGRSWSAAFTRKARPAAVLLAVAHVPATGTYWAAGYRYAGGHGHPIYHVPLIESHC